MSPTAGQLAARRDIPTRARTEAVILHHSEGPVTQTVSEIRDFHMRPEAEPPDYDERRSGPWKPGRGWLDIGYHWLVDRNGLKFKGRVENREGAHCPGWNDRSVAVCLIGNFDFAPPTRDQLDATLELIRDLLTRYPKARVLGHRAAMIEAGKDPGMRSCPGGGGRWVASLICRLDPASDFDTDKLYTG
jgi:hypothetical protein